MADSVIPDPKAIAAFAAEVARARPKVKQSSPSRVRCIGTNPETGRMIQGYIAAGEKIGTFSLPWLNDRTGERGPKPGETMILVDFDGVPRSMVRTVAVENVTFGSIDATHTGLDGPPVRAPDVWKKIHFDHWNRQLAPHGLTVSDDMPVEVDRFALVYSAEAPIYLPAGAAQPDPAAIAAFRKEAGLDGEHHVRWIGLDAASTQQIFDLIEAGDKTGTFTLPWIIDRTDGRTPKPGDALILVDMAGKPKQAVVLTRVYETRFDAITAADTAVDGTPVRDLAVWKPLHTQYWNALLRPYHLTVNGEMPVLIEQFRPVLT